MKKIITSAALSITLVLSSCTALQNLGLSDFEKIEIDGMELKGVARYQIYNYYNADKKRATTELTLIFTDIESFELVSKS